MGQSHEIAENLSRLKSTMEEELRYMRSLMMVMGMMETLFSVAESSMHNTGKNISTTNPDSHSIAQNETNEQLKFSSANDDGDAS